MVTKRIAKLMLHINITNEDTLYFSANKPPNVDQIYIVVILLFEKKDNLFN